MEKALAAWLLLTIGTSGAGPATPAPVRPKAAVEASAPRASERLRELSLLRQERPSRSTTRKAESTPVLAPR
jgi:hypothetical protein